jgi:hypothetical protein
MASVFNQALRMKTDRGMTVHRRIRVFLSSVVDEGEWSVSLLAALSPEEEQSQLHRRLSGSQSRWLTIQHPKTENSA